MSLQARIRRWHQKSLQVQITPRLLTQFVYITLLQVEWMFGLFAAYWMGRDDTLLMAAFIGISLFLGYVTSILYWFLIDSLSLSRPKKRKKRGKKT